MSCVVVTFGNASDDHAGNSFRSRECAEAVKTDVRSRFVEMQLDPVTQIRILQPAWLAGEHGFRLFLHGVAIPQPLDQPFAPCLLRTNPAPSANVPKNARRYCLSLCASRTRDDDDDDDDGLYPDDQGTKLYGRLEHPGSRASGTRPALYTF
jgi:hypothetical protein